MLTADNRSTVTALAVQAGISEVHAQLLPTDKFSLVQQIRGERGQAVAMVTASTTPPWPPPTLVSRWGRWGPTLLSRRRRRTDVQRSAASSAGPRTRSSGPPDHAAKPRPVAARSWFGLVPLAAFGVLGLAAVVFIHEVAEVFVIANRYPRRPAKPLPGTARPHSWNGPSGASSLTCCLRRRSTAALAAHPRPWRPRAVATHPRPRPCPSSP